jgi:dTDP-4-amino-4,6-dideoxygalactose transaminase
MRVAFGDLKIGDTARRYVQMALDRNWISEGENVKEFEEKFASKFGYKHAIAASSGTDADICSWLHSMISARREAMRLLYPLSALCLALIPY